VFAAQHVTDPIVSENVEGGHGEHTALPMDALNFPISQAEHDSVVEPPNPGLQEQALAHLSEVEFRGHFEQAKFPVSDLNVPSMHGEH